MKNGTVLQPIANVTHPIPNLLAQLIPIHMPPTPVMHDNTRPDVVGDEEDKN